MKINTPDQNKAIASLTKRRNAWKRDGRSVKDFPRFCAGQTTTEDYIEMFLASRNLIECPMVFADRVAPFLVGPEVTAEEVAE